MKINVVKMNVCDGLRQVVSGLKSRSSVEVDIDRALPDSISNNVQMSDCDGLRPVVFDLKSSRIIGEDIDRAAPDIISSTDSQRMPRSDVKIGSNSGLEVGKPAPGLCGGGGHTQELSDSSFKVCSKKEEGAVSDELTSQTGHRTKLVAQLCSVVRQPVQSVKLPYAVVVVTSKWPCWLVPMLALRLPLACAFFPRTLHSLFKVPTSWSNPKLMDVWATYEDFLATWLPSVPLVILASGQRG